MEVVESVTYEVERDGNGLELVVTVEGLNFVKETIPDGQMAGMTGHRPVPCESVMRFPLHRDQAYMLRDAIDAALGGPLRSVQIGHGNTQHNTF